MFRHFGEYLFEYQALLRSLQRKLEFRADALIVEKVGADTFTNALAGVLLDGHLVDVALDEWRRRSSAKEELDVETLSEILKEGLTKVNEETRRDLYDILFSDEALWTDSLPSLKNRIEVHKVKLKEPPKALPGGDTKLPSSLFTKDLEKMVNAFGPSFSFSRKVRNNGMDWRESIQELLEDSPQSPALYALLAEASGAACDDEGAAKAVRRVVEMDGENTLARTRLLSWSLRLGQMGEAAWNVSTLLEQAPDDKPFYWLENVTP